MFWHHYWLLICCWKKFCVWVFCIWCWCGWVNLCFCWAYIILIFINSRGYYYSVLNFSLLIKKSSILFLSYSIFSDINCVIIFKLKTKNSFKNSAMYLVWSTMENLITLDFNSRIKMNTFWWTNNFFTCKQKCKRAN